MEPGTRLGPYELTAFLGAGGMGEVYKAHDSRLNRTVAIKILRPGVVTADRLHRFEQEARSASALNHPNILTIHDVGREREVVYFAMEWVEGRTLRDLITGPRIPMRRVIDLAHQVSEGLAKAHAAGIVHRDIKPENVMVTDDGFVKIVDFGLAKLAESAGDTEGRTMTRNAGTTPGIVIGTVGYMSPEQAGGRPVDYRSDQFALGLLIYEMATGQRPFERATTAQSLAATIEAEPLPIDSLNPAVPQHLASVVARCLAKDPADRYESTRDLARDLKQIHAAPSHASSIVATTRSARKRWLMLAGAAVLIASSTAAWLWRPTPVVSSEAGRPLVAVRAFRNLSADASQSYFAAGISEEIHGQLSQLSALRLLSRNAVDGYGDADSRRMASELGVASIVEGSVRVAGPRVRIAVQLIHAENQQTLWSENYDRELADVLAVQSDVALQVARALQASLSAGERQRLEKRPTHNLEAYQLYLQWSQAEWQDQAERYAALGLLRKAIALDPAFGEARASLAYDLIFMGLYDDHGPAYIAEGMAEAEAALRMDPSLAGAHTALATGYQISGAVSQARLSFQRALSLDPNDRGSMNNLSILETNLGRFVEGLDWARRAFARSGRRGNDYYHVAVPLLFLRDDELTWRWLIDGERRHPDDLRVQQALAIMEVRRGRDADAAARMRRATEREPGDPEVRMTRSEVAFLTDAPQLESLLEPLIPEAAGVPAFWLTETPRVRYAYALGKRGDSARAAALVNEAERWARSKIDGGDEAPVWRMELAAIHALKQDHTSAYEALARAYDAGYREYGFLERDPIFAPVRSDRRFRALLDRMRRDVDAQRQAARERGLLDLDALMALPKVRDPLVPLGN